MHFNLAAIHTASIPGRSFWSSLATINIAQALTSLHNSGLIYRDLKPENLMLERNTPQPKLIDFGFTKDIRQKKTTSTLCGTRSYCAPEVLLQKHKQKRTILNPYDYKADAWSLGMVLMELAGNKDILDLDFPGISDIEKTSIPRRMETLGKMSDKERRQFLVTEGIKCPVQYEPLLDVIVCLTRHNPKTRMSVEEAARLLASMKYYTNQSY